MQNIITSHIHSFIFYSLLVVLLFKKKIPVGERWALRAILKTPSWLAEKVVGKLLEETASWVFQYTIEPQFDRYWSV